MKRFLVEVSGWSCIAVGVAGLFLPVLPGILLILVGLTILSAEHQWARRWIQKLRERFPIADRKIHDIINKYFRRASADATPSGSED